MWDTEENTGVLLYLQLVDRDVEIVADRGIARLISQDEWDGICRRMQDELGETDGQEAEVEELRQKIRELSTLQRVSAAIAGTLDLGNGNGIEISHEALIRSWPRLTPVD